MPTFLFRVFWAAALSLSGAVHAGVLGLPQSRQVPECHGEDGNSLECARGVEKTALLKVGPSQAFRKRDTLHINAANKRVVLKDGPRESPTAARYRYVAPVPELTAHLVHVQLYEEEGFLLLHARTGAETFLENAPVVAPGSKRFLSLSNGFDNPHSDNRIAVWRVSAAGFTKETEFTSTWGPEDAKWSGPLRARIAKGCWEDAAGDTKPCGFATLDRVGGKWQLKD